MDLWRRYSMDTSSLSMPFVDITGRKKLIVTTLDFNTSIKPRLRNFILINCIQINTLKLQLMFCYLLFFFFLVK